MSNLEKWIRAILNEEADNLSLGSVRTLQMIKQDFQSLQKENERLTSLLNKETSDAVSDTTMLNSSTASQVPTTKQVDDKIDELITDYVDAGRLWVKDAKTAMFELYIWLKYQHTILLKQELDDAHDSILHLEADLRKATASQVPNTLPCSEQMQGEETKILKSKTMIPKQIENPNGLHQRYHIEKIDSKGWTRPVDPDSEYFVMRLDTGGSDIEHIKACRIGIHAYADAIEHHIPELARDLRERYPLL